MVRYPERETMFDVLPTRSAWDAIPRADGHVEVPLGKNLCGLVDSYYL